ncbi:MAG TPA: tetratricopeptide repeat protein [Pirellulales bacterium]|nr:tetratricopeptide repeat protein [Pirellulales bacterium]
MATDVLEAPAPSIAIAPPRRMRPAVYAAALVLAAGLIAGYAWHYWPSRRFAAALRLIDSNAEEPLLYASLGFHGLALEPEQSILNAHFALRGGRPMQAIHELEPAWDCPRTHWRALVMSGAAWSNLGRLKDATVAWETALKDDDQIELHRALAAAYFDLGAIGATQYHLERWIEQSPGDPRPHRMMAKIYRDFERLVEAAEHYEIVLRAVAQNPALERFVPDVPEILVEWASCLAHLGKYDTALEALSTSDPTAEVLAIQAECYFAEGEHDKAAEAVRGALAQAPNYLPALLLQIDLALDQRRTDEALDFAQRAVAAYPTDSLSRQRLGQVYQRLGKADQAEAELEKMDELKELRLWFTELHERAAERPYDADVRYELGQVAEKLTWGELAADWYNAALKIDPDHQKAHEALEVLYQQTYDQGDRHADSK